MFWNQLLTQNVFGNEANQFKTSVSLCTPWNKMFVYKMEIIINTFK